MLSEDQKYQKMYDLTETEMKVLNCLCHGLNNDEVAQKLFISPCTLRTHLNNIYSKLGLSRTRENANSICRTQAVIYALKNNVFPEHDNNIEISEKLNINKSALQEIISIASRALIERQE